MSEFTSSSDACAKKCVDDPLNRIGQIQFVKPLVLSEDYDCLDEGDFHVATAAAKKIMFREHQPTYLSQNLKCKEIHERLRNLAPDIAKHFIFKDDPAEKMTFRLWAQRETEEMREDAYVALSYCWASPTYLHQEGVRYPLPISPLMFAALAMQREWRTTGAWIDQLCIDQKNKVEKGLSIAAMDTVYRCAQTVVIVLDDIEVTLAQQDFLRNFIKGYESFTGKLEMPYARETPPFFEKNPVFYQFFYTVLGSRYFTRAWCAQETELGTRLVFYIPCQARIDGEEVKEILVITPTFVYDMLKLSGEVPGEREELREKLARKFDILARLRKAHRQVTGKNLAEDKYDTLVPQHTAQIRETFDLRAGGDPDLPLALRESSALHDKISIVLNVVETGLAVTPTPQVGRITEEEAVCRLMILSLAALDPTVLCNMGKPLNLTSKADGSSWLCRPAYRDLGSGFLRGQRLPPLTSKLASCLRIDPNPEQTWIQLDTMALGLQRPPAEKYRQIAINLTQKGIELGLGRGPPGPHGDLGAEYAGKTDLVSRIMLWTIDSTSRWGFGPRYEYWQCITFLADFREQFNGTIACILECGMSWMLGTAKKCGYPEVDHLKTKLCQYFQEDHFEGIQDMTWAETQAGRDAVSTIFATATWAIHWGASWEKREMSMPMLFEHGRKGTAMVFVPTDTFSQVVVPCLLLPDAYARLYRVWILNAKDDPFYDKMLRGEKPQWYLRDKAILFTDVEIEQIVLSLGSAEDGQPGWRLRPRVTVHGPPRESTIPS